MEVLENLAQAGPGSSVPAVRVNLAQVALGSLVLVDQEASAPAVLKDLVLAAQVVLESLDLEDQNLVLVVREDLGPEEAPEILAQAALVLVAPEVPVALHQLRR